MTDSQHKISEFVQQWLELRLADRKVTAAELCGDHPDLVPQVEEAIEAVLKMEQRFQVSVSRDRIPGTPGNASTIIEPGKLASQEPNERPLPSVPGYEVIEELGRGGMGVVYKARHRKLDRIVALKMIKAGTDRDSSQIARFQTEAKLLAQLQHPNIVQLYDVGECDAQPYLALEFVDGGSLKAIFQKRELSFLDVARIVETLARAMHEAHGRQIVHRDLKPENVLLTRDGVPKIADFGLAKLLQLEPGSAGTKSGTILGTPSYMAPEQAEGKIKEIGPRTDIYALGAVLFDGLTGRPPFREATVFATMLKIAEEAAPSPRTFEPKVPKSLDEICLKCLARTPDDRFSTMEEFADRLKEFILANEEQRTKRWTLGNRVFRLMMLGVIIFAAAALGFLLSRPVDTYLYAMWKGQQPDWQTIRHAVEESDVANRELHEALTFKANGNVNAAVSSAESALRRFEKLSASHPQWPTFEAGVTRSRSLLEDLQRHSTKPEAAKSPAALQQKTARLLGLDVAVKNSIGMDLMFIPPGKFRMGSPQNEVGRIPEELEHEVEITAGFYLGKYEVTQAEYEAIMGSSNPSQFKGTTHPVEQTTWPDAKEFCRKLSEKEGKVYTLPSEAEWEYACRGGMNGPFSTGDNLTTTQANYNGGRPYPGYALGEWRKTTIAVGSFAANGFGLHDMHGNVWEWCEDWAGDYETKGLAVDPKGPAGGAYRVRRGGSWGHAANECRSAFRSWHVPLGRTHDQGFRVLLRSIQPEVKAVKVAELSPFDLLVLKNEGSKDIAEFELSTNRGDPIWKGKIPASDTIEVKWRATYGGHFVLRYQDHSGKSLELRRGFFGTAGNLLHQFTFGQDGSVAAKTQRAPK